MGRGRSSALRHAHHVNRCASNPFRTAAFSRFSLRAHARFSTDIRATSHNRVPYFPQKFGCPSNGTNSQALNQLKCKLPPEPQRVRCKPPHRGTPLAPPVRASTRLSAPTIFRRKSGIVLIGNRGAILASIEKVVDLH